MNIILAVVALITGVMAARLLGPESRGHLAAAQTVGTLVGAIGSLSLGESLVYFVGRRTRPPRVVLLSAVAFATISTALAIVLAFVVMPVLLAGEPDAITPARAYSMIGLTFVLVGFPITFLRARERYRLWNLLRLIGPVSWLAALVWMALSSEVSVTLLIVLFISAQALCIPFVWHMATRGTTKAAVDRSLLVPMLRYGAPLLLATMPIAFNIRLDQLFLANAESADQLGLYAVSVSWAALGLPLMAAIGSVLFPRLASTDSTELPLVLGKSSRAGILIAMGVAVVSALSAPVFVPFLFGEAFAVPVALPVTLAVATSLLGYNGLLEEGLRGAGEPRSVLLGESVGLAVTVTLLFLLVPPIGVVGAAIASLFGYAGVTATLVWSTRRRVPISVRSLMVPTRTDIAALAHQVALGVRRARSRVSRK
jgi:O-antigen/teichoic acid export membrane protein